MVKAAEQLLERNDSCGTGHGLVNMVTRIASLNTVRTSRTRERDRHGDSTRLHLHRALSRDHRDRCAIVENLDISSRRRTAPLGRNPYEEGHGIGLSARSRINLNRYLRWGESEPCSGAGGCL